MKLVIAGSYEQYRNWVRENRVPESGVMYVSDVRNLVGLRGCDVEYVGTWTDSQVFKDHDLATYLLKRVTEKE